MRIIAIHPRCEIEEKARIFRICVWLSPIHPPRAAERMAMIVSSVGFKDWEVIYSSVIGGNFMMVDSRRPVVRDEPWSTSGNQKWKGTSPSFIAIAEVRTSPDTGLDSWVMSHCPVNHALVMLENSTKAEAAD